MHRNSKKTTTDAIQELSGESRRMGLKINIAKTKVVVVDNTSINVNNAPLIENVECYLGQHYSIKDAGQIDTTKNHRMLGGIRQTQGYRQKPPCHQILPEETGVGLQLMCCVPDMTHGAETTILIKQAQNKLAAAQTNMERSMLNTTYKVERPTYGSGRGQQS